jgi:hypothetical protein
MSLQGAFLFFATKQSPCNINFILGDEIASGWRPRNDMALTNKKAVRKMDSPFSFRYVNLTCFPFGAAEHFHSHYAAHGHGRYHHWVSRFVFHGV